MVSNWSGCSCWGGIWGSKGSTDGSGVTPEQGQCPLGCANSNISIPVVCSEKAPQGIVQTKPPAQSSIRIPRANSSWVWDTSSNIWELHNKSGQAVLISDHSPRVLRGFPYSSMSIASHPVHGHCWEEHAFVALSPITQVIDENG